MIPRLDLVMQGNLQDLCKVRAGDAVSVRFARDGGLPEISQATWTCMDAKAYTE